MYSYIYVEVFQNLICQIRVKCHRTVVLIKWWAGDISQHVLTSFLLTAENPEINFRHRGVHLLHIEYVRFISLTYYYVLVKVKVGPEVREPPCSVVRQFVATPFNTIASTIRDCFRRLGMRQHGWRLFFRCCADHCHLIHALCFIT